MKYLKIFSALKERFRSSAGRKIVVSKFVNFLVIATAVGVIVLGMNIWRDRTAYTSANEAIVNGKVSIISPEIDGTLIKFNLSAGDRVRVGQVLFEIKDSKVPSSNLTKLEGSLGEIEVHTQGKNAELKQARQLLKQYESDTKRQQALEIARAERELAQAKKELDAAKSRENLAQTEYDRTRELVEAGAQQMRSLDVAESDLQIKRSERQGAEDKVGNMEAALLAAKSGLTLDKTRSQYDPILRWQEQLIAVADLEREVISLTKKKSALEAELSTSKKDFLVLSVSVQRSNFNGVIWKAIAREGQIIQKGQTIVELIDCDKRWIDAQVEETAAREIKPGQLAEMDLYGSTTVLKGKVVGVRGGLGRLTLGEQPALPTASNLPRQAQVKIELPPGAPKDGDYCYIGFTGIAKIKR